MNGSRVKSVSSVYRFAIHPNKAFWPVSANNTTMSFDDLQQLPPEFKSQPLTARMLDDYATCPRKFLLSFFTTRDAERHFRGGPAALHQAVRQAILDWHSQGGPDAMTVERLLQTFEQHWEGELCADALEEEQLHRQGLQMLRDYYTDQATARTEFVAADLRLSGFLGEQAFVAVADLVLAPGPEREQYMRLVTARHPPGPAELAQDVSAQILWLLVRERQSVVPPEARTVLYYALRKRKAYEVTLTDDQAAYLRHDLESRIARIHRDAAFEPHKGQYCRWCRSRARCPAWRR